MNQTIALPVRVEEDMLQSGIYRWELRAVDGSCLVGALTLEEANQIAIALNHFDKAVESVEITQRNIDHQEGCVKWAKENFQSMTQKEFETWTDNLMVCDRARYRENEALLASIQEQKGK